MTTSAHEPRRTASDGLMLQVSAANVLQLHRLYLAQYTEMADALEESRLAFTLGQPGHDPISHDYTPDFQTRVNAIVAMYKTERDELREVSERLAEAAREYGHAEAEIADSFRRAYPHLAPPPVTR
ncbi:hypothetical protein [Pseudonocardia spirodelae]|uniref:PE domain-containing protein n=1 Tax=Pseudonocardia spirodelae TaxID=3133431 RepID=A0ABU8TD46_9PSEU